MQSKKHILYAKEQSRKNKLRQTFKTEVSMTVKEKTEKKNKERKENSVEGQIKV